MKRAVEDKTILDKFVEDFVQVVEQHVKYIIVSGFVAISHGRSRGTEDIDMIIEAMPVQKFTALHEHLARTGFECIQSENTFEIFSYLKDGMSVRYIKKDSFVPEMEIKFEKDLLDKYQLQTRTKLPLTGLDVYFSSIEMNIAFKEELLKSDKDMEDAKHLRIVYAGKINEGEIAKIKDLIKRFRLK